MIQLEKFEGGELVADTNYLYPARWGWINEFSLLHPGNLYLQEKI